MPSRLSRLDDAETLRGLVRDLREGIYVTDRDGRVLDANRAFLAMFGVVLARRAPGLEGRGPRRRRRAPRGRARAPPPRRRGPGLRDGDPPRRTARSAPSSTRRRASKDPETRRGLLSRHPDRHHGPQAPRAAPPRPEPARPAHGLLQPAVPERVRATPRERVPSVLLGRVGLHHGRPRPLQAVQRRVRARGGRRRPEPGRAVPHASDARRGGRRAHGRRRVPSPPRRRRTRPRTEFAARRLQSTADRELIVPFSLGWAAREDGETLEKTIARADQAPPQVARPHALGRAAAPGSPRLGLDRASRPGPGPPASPRRRSRS